MSEKDSPALPAVTEHEEEVEALRLLVQLLLSSDEAVPVRVACDDGTIREIEVGAGEADRQEVVAILRRQLSRLLH